jgi:hypothetical protein
VLALDHRVLHRRRRHAHQGPNIGARATDAFERQPGRLLKEPVGRAEPIEVSNGDSADAAIDRLIDAYEQAGLGPVRRASDVEPVLARIARTIAPMRLPDDVIRFWRRVDPERITVAPYPGLISPDFALESWEMHRDELPGMTPRLLFPVCYESHGFLFVELDTPDRAGGACLEWGYAGSPFHLRFPRFAAYLDLLATMIELGEFERPADPRHMIAFDPYDRWADAVSVRLAAAQPVPGFGHARELDEDVRQWPEHWLTAHGLAAQDRGPRGEHTTIDELLAATSGRGGTGRIRGRVTSLAGSAEGARVTIADGTGSLDVWCPAAVCTYGPVLGREFELDVTVDAQVAPPSDWSALRAEVEDRALAHELDEAAAAAARLSEQIFGTAASARATAIRPAD